MNCYYSDGFVHNKRVVHNAFEVTLKSAERIILYYSKLIRERFDFTLRPRNEGLVLL